MALLSEGMLELIAEKYMLASTPDSFFDGLRSIQTLSVEADKLRTQDILDRLDALTASMDSLDQLMETYGLIMTLSYKNDLSIPAALRRYAQLKKDWIGIISVLTNGTKVPLDQYEVPIGKASWDFKSPDLGSPASDTESQASGQSATQENGG